MYGGGHVISPASSPGSSTCMGFATRRSESTRTDSTFPLLPPTRVSPERPSRARDEAVISLGRVEEFFTNKKYKEKKLSEIIIVICAILNSNGGKVVLHTGTDSNVPGNIPEGVFCFSQMLLQVIRMLEQSMISIIGSQQTVSKIDFKEDRESIIILVKKADSLITTNFKLYLPSETQVIKVFPWEPLEKIKDDIINRKVVPQAVLRGSHTKMFFKGKICGFRESKTVELKNVEATRSKHTRLADRMTGKGNKFTCYISGFANHSGGHIYYGITDDARVVEGELISNEEDKREITKKVEKAINRMIWPDQIGQPKRGEHWDIFFEPVLDNNSKPIPSTFVIVIYVAPCLGGVFTEEPECYELVKGKVESMPFTTWKKRILQPVWLGNKDEIFHPPERNSFILAEARKAFSLGNTILKEVKSEKTRHASLRHSI